MQTAHTSTAAFERISVISALPGGKAAKVLEAIANPDCQPINERRFEWDNEGDCYNGRVCYRRNGVETIYPLTLVLGRVAELHLEDTPYFRSWSGKARRAGNGTFVLPIGETLPTERLRSIANDIVASWVIRGFGWQNAKGITIAMPYGADPTRENSRKRRRRRRRQLCRSRYERHRF